MKKLKVLVAALTAATTANLACAQIWTPMPGSPIDYWPSIACSADGNKLVAIEGGTSTTRFYTSTNSGATWTQQTNAPDGFLCAASSADGNKLVIGTGNGPVYISTDSGATWNPTDTPNER